MLWCSASANQAIILQMFGNARLPELHLEILKLVWLEWDSTKTGGRIVDGGLTRDEIFEGLKGTYQSGWRPPKPKVGEIASPVLPSAPPLVRESTTLKRHLQQLCADHPRYTNETKFLTRGKVTDRAGSPFVYKINDIMLATWPSTAFMLTEVWKAKHMGRQVLIDAMVHQQNVIFLADKSATPEQIREEIEKQINWCLAQHYLEHVEEHKLTDYRAAHRLHYEYRLLDFISSSSSIRPV